MTLSSMNFNVRILTISLPIIVLAFFQEWRDYFELWSTSYIYRHGFLIFGGSAFLLFQRRHNFRNLPLSISLAGLAVLIFLVLTLLVAHAGNIKLIRMLLLPLMLIAWGWTLWGRGFLKLAAAPLLLLLFGAPFWDEMSPALQWLTVAVDEWALGLLSIPTTIDEFYITIPSGVFHVAHGCSGIRYLMVGLYLGAFYATLTHSGVKRSAGLIVAGGLLSLLTNWIRVAWIIAAGHYTDMESSLIDDHEMFGWAVFIVITLLPFFALTHILDKKDGKIPTKTNYTPELPGSSQRTYKPIFFASLPLLAVPAVLFMQSQIAQGNAKDWQPQLPEGNASTWKGPLKHAEFWEPEFHGYDIHLSGVYVSEGHEQAQLDFFGYHRQVQGKELIYYRNSVFDRENWKPIEINTSKIPSPRHPDVLTVNQITLENEATKKLAVVWYWYDIGGTAETSLSGVQLLSALKNLLGDQRAGVWILTTQCNQLSTPASCTSEAEVRLESFLLAHRPHSMALD